jgi:hypothetical protein
MRKFLFSSTVISALFGALTVVKSTRQGPRDWRLALMWISWACTMAIAVGTVVKEAKTHNEIKE